MQFARKVDLDFALFRLFVGPVRIARSAVGRSRTGRLADIDLGQFEAREQQSAGLPVPESGLAMLVETTKDVDGELKGLARVSDIEGDHAASTLPAGRRPHGRSIIMPPSRA
jgi:hypothetical protein